MLASEALPLLTAKLAKNAIGIVNALGKSARLKKRRKPVESAQPNLSIEPQVL